MTTACDIVARARRFVGVRFAHQGRSEAGLDCLGLLMLVADAAGLTFDGVAATQLDVPGYGMKPDVLLLKRKLDTHLVAVEQEEIAVGDIVLLRIEGSPQHLALITDYPMAGELGMIHAYAPARKVVEHRYDTYWKNMMYSAYRLPQIASDSVSG